MEDHPAFVLQTRGNKSEWAPVSTFRKCLLSFFRKEMACVHSTSNRTFFHYVHSTFCSFVEVAHSWGSSKTDHFSSMMLMLGATHPNHWVETLIWFLSGPTNAPLQKLCIADCHECGPQKFKEYLWQTVTICCYHYTKNRFQQDRTCVV